MVKKKPTDLGLGSSDPDVLDPPASYEASRDAFVNSGEDRDRATEASTGRSTSYKATYKHRLSLDLTDDQKEALDAASKKYGMKKNQIVRQAILMWLAKAPELHGF